MQTATKPQHLDMLNGPIWNKLPRYALPVAATGILGQLFNAADIAVVGNFTGDMRTAAVAAVGANSPVIGLLLNLFIGIALGANVVIANAIGRGDRETVHRAVHTSIVTALIGGVIVAIFGQFIAAGLMGLLNVPDDVYPLALAYLRIYLLGMPVILLYNFEAAIFRSVGDTKVPLIALTVSGVLNVILNLFFVIVLKMNVNGVAIATVLSNAVSSVLLLRRLLGGMLPALSGALFFGLLQDGSPAVTAALLGYVLWRTAKRCGGGWIVLSVICFAAGLLKERALLLLLPLYLIGYVCTRLSRRTGLGRSLALTLPLSLLGALGVAVLGWWMAGRGTPLEALRSFRFYEALWPALCGNVRAAVTLPGRFSPSELALGALAVLTLPELLHGLCRGHDLRCAMILLLLVSAAALWALSGLFLLPLPLAMALAWVWQRLCDRGAAVSAAVPAAVLALCAVSSILFMF